MLTHLLLSRGPRHQKNHGFKHVIQEKACFAAEDFEALEFFQHHSVDSPTVVNRSIQVGDESASRRIKRLDLARMKSNLGLRHCRPKFGKQCRNLLFGITFPQRFQWKVSSKI